jgi:phage regulator Rha-like protein
MSRKEILDKLKSKLKEKQIYEFREELEEFLQEDSDSYTKELQKAISEKLDGVNFYYQSFDDFINDYRENNENDPAGYSDFYNRIYGEW